MVDVTQEKILDLQVVEREGYTEDVANRLADWAFFFGTEYIH